MPVRFTIALIQEYPDARPTALFRAAPNEAAFSSSVSSRREEVRSSRHQSGKNGEAFHARIAKVRRNLAAAGWPVCSLTLSLCLSPFLLWEGSSWPILTKA